MSLRKRMFGEDEPSSADAAQDDQPQTRGQGAGEPEAQGRGARLVTGFDRHGREIALTIDEFQRDVLPETLEAVWSEPEDLAGAIQWALNEGCAEAVVDATSRLREIDPVGERSCWYAARTLIDAGKATDAEAMLKKHLGAQSRKSSQLLTLLAEAYEVTGRTMLVRATVWSALEADPNDPNALRIWCRMLDPDGDGGQRIVPALLKAEELPGSWRAAIWRARVELEAGRIENALPIYEATLDRVPDEDRWDAAGAISGALGMEGHAGALVALFDEHTDPEVIGPEASLNFLTALVDMRLTERARWMIGRIRQFDFPPLRDDLERLEREIADLERGGSEPDAPEDEPELAADDPPGLDEITVVSHVVENPMWFEGLRLPGWLRAAALDALPTARVALLPFAYQRDDLPEGISREDDASQMSRGLMLLLHEWLELRTDADPVTLFPVVEGGGVVLTAHPWSFEQATGLVDRAGVEADYFITGSYIQDDRQFGVELQVLDAASGDVVGEVAERREWPVDLVAFSDDVFRQIAGLLRELAGVAEVAGPDWYAPPRDDLLREYMVGQAQLLVLSMAAAGLLDDGSLWGERNILEWLAHLAMDHAGTESEAAGIMLLAGLALNREYGSTLYQEFAQRAQAIDRAYEGEPDSVIRRLGPLLFSLMGLGDDLRERVAELGTDVPAGYSDWLARI